VLTLFFDVTYEGKTYKAGLFGGAGVNAVKLTYLYKNDSPLDFPQQLIASAERMKQEKVDIHLGNHPGNNHTFEKYRKMSEEGGNPFIDENSWGNFLEELQAKVYQIIEENDRLDAEIDKLLN
jgi:metallo-beta-lactamase class B